MDDPLGVRVGNYFWIFGGWAVTQDFNAFELILTEMTAMVPKTSLWVIDKERWIEGPEIHPLIRWSCNDYSGLSSIKTGPNKYIGWKISLNLPSSLKLTRQAIPMLPINIATLL